MVELIASSKPKMNYVVMYGRVVPFTRVRKKILSEDECYVALMKQAAKITLRRVKILNNIGNNKIW